MHSSLTSADRPVTERDATGPIVPAAIVLMAAYAVWSAVAPPFETRWEYLVDEIAILPFRLGVAALGLWLGHDDRTEAEARSAWRWLGGAFVLSSLANVLRVTGTGGAPLDPTIAIGIALPQASLMLGGLWQLARLRKDRGRIADWLDAGVIVIAGLLLAAHYAAGGNPFDSSLYGERRWLFLLYLSADLCAVLFVATAWFRRPDGVARHALGLLTLGFAVIAIADLGYDQEIQRGTWQNGGALDASVAAGMCLLVLGMDIQRRRAPHGTEPRTAIRQGRHIVAPIAILAATIPMLQLAWSARHATGHLTFHVTGVSVLLLLVLIRQHVAREQTVQLARERMAADARFRSLVQRSSDAILQVSTDHVIQWASPSAGELAGTIPALLVGRRIGDLAHPEDRDRLSVFLANASEPFSRNAALRWRIGRPDHWHDVESVVTDLTADPGVRSLVLNTRNVTERVRLEQQLRQSQKLEAVGRLAGGIAHDFNNILAAIMSHAQLLRDGLAAEDERVADLLEIEQTAQRGAVLTRRLLSFSRPEAGELRAQQITPVIRGMEPMLRRLLVGQVELELHLVADGLWVRTAEGQIEQILMNLTINARDAMPDGGAVRISTRALTIRPGDRAESTGRGVLPGHWAELVVRDEGTGMDAATLDRLFEPFFTTKPSGLGTGLGLTTVRGIVRALGGHVFAESAPAAGTTMRVLLPLVPAETETAVAVSGSPANVVVGKPVVLVVDDELALRRAMERFLDRSGYTVLGAESAQEALRLLDAREWRVDLVVTDMVMPRMGGREFVRLLRERRPELPILCVSGHMEADPRDADDPSAPWAPERLLAKPFEFAEFVSRVRDTLAITPAPPL